MQNARAAAGGAWRPHLGYGRWGPEHKERWCGHPDLRAGKGDTGALQGCQWTRDDQTGAVSSRVRRSLLPGVQVSAVAMMGSLISSRVILDAWVSTFRHFPDSIDGYIVSKGK